MSFPESDPDGITPNKGAVAFDVKALLATARRYYWIPLLTVAAALLAGGAYLKISEPVYRSSGEIKVERRMDRDPDADRGEVVSLFENAAAEDMKTIERVFLSPALIDRVIGALNLKGRDGFVAPDKPAAEVNEGDLKGYLAMQSQISLVPDTRLIQVSFESWSPAIAQEVVQALVKEGIDFYHDQRTGAINTNIRNLREETKKLEDNLVSSEEKLNDYMRKLGSVSVDQDLNLLALQLRELNSTLSVLKADRLKLESDFEQIAKARGDVDKLIAIRSVRDIPAVLSLSSRANELRGNFAKIQERYGSNHPFKLQAESELKMVEQSLKEEILKAPDSIEATLNVARRNESSLMEEQSRLEGKVIEIKTKAVEFQVFQRQVDADRLSYESALKRLNKELAQGRVQPVLIQAVGEAGYGYRASLGPIRVLATCIVGGLMLGAGLILLIAQSDKSFQSVEDIEQTLGLSVLASVPVVLARGGGEPGRYLVPVHDQRDSLAAESFRTLTTFLQGDEAAGLGQLLLLTSAEAGEGKSFCSLNLAIAQAQSGQRTLLVDTSLSRPAFGKELLGVNEHAGLSDYLVGGVPFSSLITASPYPNLDVVTTGTSASHLVEIFSRTRFREFLDEARVLYDQIIFDSAPVTTSSDTLSIARFFPMVCLVVEASKTSRDAVTRAVELLTRAGARPTGVIFSRDRRYQKVNSLPVKLHAAETAVEISCSACGRRYASREECVRSTLPCSGEVSARQCACGATVALPRAGRRDSSAQGQLRRDIFGDLLARLEAAGLSREKARAMLLLTLKVWRNEIGEDPHRDTSQAGVRRRELIEEFLKEVGKSGLGREEAEAKLLEAAQSWREAP